MKLSIIIVNHNSGTLTKSCVDSVLSQNLPFDFEIIVVDNDSRDESVSMLRDQFPEIKVIDNKENRGFGAGVNQGLAVASGEFNLMLNPDIIVMSDAIEQMVAYLEANEEIGILGAQMIYPNGKLQYSCFRYYTPMTIIYRRTPLGATAKGKAAVDSFLMLDYDHKNVRDVDWLMGSCLMVRRAVYEKIGGMDERFFMYFEDVDWCRRSWRAGWRVTYLPAAKMSHFHQRSSELGGWLGILSNFTVRAHIISAFKYFWKYRGKEVVHH